MGTHREHRTSARDVTKRRRRNRGAHPSGNDLPAIPGHAARARKREIGVTAHALARYRLHYPDATNFDLLNDLRHGEPIENMIALTMLGRSPTVRREVPTRYVPGTARQGPFVISPDDSGSDGVVTYLRLGLLQQQFALEQSQRRRDVREPIAVIDGAADARPAQPLACPGSAARTLRAIIDEGAARLNLALPLVCISAQLRALFGSANRARLAIAGGALVEASATADRMLFECETGNGTARIEITSTGRHLSATVL